VFILFLSFQETYSGRAPTPSNTITLLWQPQWSVWCAWRHGCKISGNEVAHGLLTESWSKQNAPACCPEIVHHHAIPAQASSHKRMFAFNVLEMSVALFQCGFGMS
jgi:hypothetical protein